MNNAFDTPLALKDTYTTPDSALGSRFLATPRFYALMMTAVARSAQLAKKNAYDDKQWVLKSWDIFRALERSGVFMQMTGLQYIRTTEKPAVIVSNHMSTLETFVLPMLINPIKRCTFVIKPSLMDYPVFGHVMRARNPIVVSRDNPRQDLITVLEEGKKRLEDGISVILFPQTTRRTDFVAEEFNSLGVKLAKNAGCPVIPLALKTDAWQNGSWIKDFGKIDARKKVHLEFGAPIEITTSGKAEHAQIVEFIQTRINMWTQEERKQ